MAFTKITAAGIGSTETVTLDGVAVINNESIGGNLTVTGNATIGGVLTYEDVTNVDSVGLITARNGIVVGSGITLSPDGDIFFTGIMTGNGSGLTGVANTDVIFTDKITLPDSAAGSINVGLASDLQIYHDGSQSVIKDTGTGQLLISGENTIAFTNAAATENYARMLKDGAVELYHNNNKKLETASGGVTVTGTVAATSYTGDGSALTGIEAGIQTSVPKSVSGITTVLDLSKDDFKVTAAGITTIDVRGGSEGNSHTLRIHNSGITTVGFSTYFLFPSGAAPIIPTADGTISLISFTVDRQGAVGLATQLLAGSSVNFS